MLVSTQKLIDRGCQFRLVRHITSPLRVCGGPVPVGRAPSRGEHTEQLLSELLGYDEPTLRALAEDQVFAATTKQESAP